MMFEQIKQMKNVDIRTVEKDTLVEASNIIVDMEMPKIPRMVEMVKKLGNPFCFLCGNVAVKVEYDDTTTATVDDRYEVLLRTQ